MSVDSMAARPGGVAAPVVATPTVAVDVDAVPLRDRVRWGPVVAGVVTGFAILLVLSVLGLALGISTLGGDSTAQDWGTAAGIWGAITLLIAFFVGGWLAGHSATTAREGDGLLNGFLTGAATLLILLWLATTALTGALGFFASTVTGLAGAAAPAAIEAVDQGAVANPASVPTAVANAVQNPQSAVPAQAEQTATAVAQAAQGKAGPGAWGTTIAMILALIVAALGGMAGHNQNLGTTRGLVRRG